LFRGCLFRGCLSDRRTATSEHCCEAKNHHRLSHHHPDISPVWSSKVSPLAFLYVLPGTDIPKLAGYGLIDDRIANRPDHPGITSELSPNHR
jgi:hypothetical protein